ncbi:MAG: YjfB family protein [Clostridiales bacterium]|nr:YjfB family protein [Clostridiales bacterium]
MNLGTLDMALNALNTYDVASVGAGSVSNSIGTAVLGKSLDITEQMGASMIKMMEQSVNPGVGRNIDVYV